MYPSGMLSPRGGGVEVAKEPSKYRESDHGVGVCRNNLCIVHNIGGFQTLDPLEGIIIYCVLS